MSYKGYRSDSIDFELIRFWIVTNNGLRKDLNTQDRVLQNYPGIGPVRNEFPWSTDEYR